MRLAHVRRPEPRPACAPGRPPRRRVPAIGGVDWSAVARPRATSRNSRDTPGGGRGMWSTTLSPSRAAGLTRPQICSGRQRPKERPRTRPNDGDVGMGTTSRWLAMRNRAAPRIQRRVHCAGAERCPRSQMPVIGQPRVMLPAVYRAGELTPRRRQLSPRVAIPRFALTLSEVRALLGILSPSAGRE